MRMYLVMRLKPLDVEDERHSGKREHKSLILKFLVAEVAHKIQLPPFQEVTRGGHYGR